jgi:hypothetical protein
MKYALFALLSGSLVLFISLAQVKKTSGAVFEPIWPQVGMPISDLQKALGEIKPLMPSQRNAETNILYLAVPNPDTIRITTGVQNGPRAGRGRQYEFRKVDGKWKLETESEWVS